jgi:hypothetical protein
VFETLDLLHGGGAVLCNLRKSINKVGWGSRRNKGRRREKGEGAGKGLSYTLEED